MPSPWPALLAVHLRQRAAAPPPADAWQGGALQGVLDQALQQARLAHAAADAAARDAGLAEAATLGRVLALALRAPVAATLVWQPASQPAAARPPQRLLADGVQAAPAALVEALAAALLVGDRPALHALMAPGVMAAAWHSGTGPGHEPHWVALGEAWAAAVSGEVPSDALAAAWAVAVAAAADAQALWLPQLALLEALARRDSQACRAALVAAFDGHQAHHAQPERRGLTLGLAAWTPSAALALAQHLFAPPDPGPAQAGWSAGPWQQQPAWCPAAQVAPAVPATVLLQLSAPVLADARQAGWWADAMGMPRAGRHADPVDQGLQLAAPGRFGIDRWQAWCPLDPHASALPAAVVLAASDQLAQQVSDKPSDDALERSWQLLLLGQALAALDTVLLAPPDDRSAAALDIERLQARRTAYATLLARLATQLPAPPASPAAEVSADVDDAGSQADAQARAIALAALLQAQVQPLLQALADDRSGTLVQQLRPRPGDAARAFQPALAGVAEAASAAQWAAGPRLPHAQPGSRVVCHAAPAGLLDHDNALSRHFPGGYRAIAHLLQPQRVWLAWQVLAPGQSAGMAYDGLVWLDDHWAWFPKPFRLMRAGG